MLIFQAWNKISEVFQSLKPITLHAQELVPYNVGFYIHLGYIKNPLFANAYISVMKQHFKVFQSPELTTHHVQVTSDLGTLQCGILHSP